MTQPVATVISVVAGLVLGAVVGAVLGAGVVWVLAAGRLSAGRAELAAVRAALEQQRALGAERQTAWEESRRQLLGEFAELSQQALTRNAEQFLQLADERLAQARQAAVGDLDLRRQAIAELLTPLRDQLGRYEQGLHELERQRQHAYAGLGEQVRQLAESQDRLRSETRNLVTALRAPATRGRWGELQLRRVVEMAGMVEHCDFEEQVTAATDDGRLRPDLVVRLPGAKQVVVDAKVPLQAFLDASEAVDETTRRVQLSAHARHLRAHVDALAKKAYWQQFEPSPEFVVAFVPGDPLLAAALEHDPSLLEHAVANHVLLATPTTLIALLRTVATTWQHEALAANARQVQQAGRELYKRLSTFGEHLARTGRGLSSAVDAYNKAVGSLERSVLPQARRFRELGVVGAGEEDLPEPDQVERAVRHLQPADGSLGALPADGSLGALPADGSLGALPAAEAVGEAGDEAAGG